MEHLNDPSHENHYYIKKVVEILAICNTVIVEEQKGKLSFNASSPDELALVNAAKYFGFELIGRDEDNNILIKSNGHIIKYEVLNIIEFTSTRKRMTVVLKDPRGKIRVMCKGADNII